jgi:hypothetical protein
VWLTVPTADGFPGGTVNFWSSLGGPGGTAVTYGGQPPPQNAPLTFDPVDSDARTSKYYADFDVIFARGTQTLYVSYAPPPSSNPPGFIGNWSAVVTVN